MSLAKNRSKQPGYRCVTGGLPAFTVDEPENSPIVWATWALTGFQSYAGPFNPSVARGIDQRGRKIDIGVRGM